ncbi:MAG: class I SAM-dependent methyltransferase [bacterium]|nr:class I SAM-dependent methyltransferase [bacterium]
MNKLYKKINSCRVCHSSNLINVLYLGNLYISDFVKSNKHSIKAPLGLTMCKNCSLVQLTHKGVNPDLLYRNYWYKSGINSTMKQALKDITLKAEKIVKLKDGDVVLDIGANDGTLLRSYETNQILRIGFEPAKNLKSDYVIGTDKIINDFFSAKNYKKYDFNKPKIITAIAMFYDLEDPNKFVGDISEILANDGLFIIQMAYQPLMLKLNAFDNICHEHIEYYSLKSVEKLMKRNDLEIFNVELNNVNGGSFRIYIKHKNAKFPKPSLNDLKKVNNLLKIERATKVNTVEAYKNFAQKIADLKKTTTKFLKNKSRLEKIYVYGASTKGNTLLQYYGLNNKIIKAAVERNPNKFGLKTVGSLIPIISEEKARTLSPDYLLILPWHFKKEFIEREKNYIQKGGKMIFPLPNFEIVDNEKLY